MTDCLISKTEMLDLLHRHNFDENEAAIQEMVQLIQRKLNVNLNSPISDKLRFELKSKLNTLKISWTRLSTDFYKDLFRKEIFKRTCKIKVPPSDLNDDGLLSRFKVLQDEHADTKTQNSRLEKSVRDLQLELSNMRSKLCHAQANINVETGRQAQYKAVEIMAQAEQASAQATLDFHAKLQGKRNTIKNILIAPYLAEMNETGAAQQQSQPKPQLWTYQQPSTSASCSQQSSMSLLNLPPGTPLFTKAVTPNGGNEKSKEKLNKFLHRKNYYLVGERQKVRLKSQIKGIFTSINEYRAARPVYRI